MNDTIWQSIASTPWWAYVLFAYILYATFLASKPYKLPVRKLMILPIFFFVTSLGCMYVLIKPDAASFALWAVLALLGSGFGWLHYRARKIKAVADEQSLQMPGTWSALIVFIAAITLKYYFDFQLDLSPELFRTPPYVAGMMAFYGYFTGLFCGRYFYARYTVKHGPFVEATIHTS